VATTVGAEDLLTPTATQSFVDGHEMVQRPATPDGTFSVTQEVPPFLVATNPKSPAPPAAKTCPTTTQSLVEGHETALSAPSTGERILSLAHVAPPLVVAPTVPGPGLPTTKQSFVDGHETAMAFATPDGAFLTSQVAPPSVVVTARSLPSCTCIPTATQSFADGHEMAVRYDALVRPDGLRSLTHVAPPFLVTMTGPTLDPVPPTATQSFVGEQEMALSPTDSGGDFRIVQVAPPFVVTTMAPAPELV
jgi:hypothetical protein